GGNEHVVADGGQQAIGGEEHHRLDVHIEGQHPVDDGGKQVLVVDHRNDGEEHHQQGGEGQRLLEGAADLVLLDDAVEGGQQDDHHQSDQAHGGNVESQPEHQDQGGDGLYHQGHLGAQGALLGLGGIEFSEHGPHRVGQFCAVAEGAGQLQQQAGEESAGERRHGHRGHHDEEVAELPARLFGDQQVLGLTHHGGHAAEGRAHHPVHDQAAQKGAELFEIVAVQLDDL